MASLQDIGINVDEDFTPVPQDPRTPGDLLKDAYWGTFYVVLDLEKHADGTTKSITVMNLNKPNEPVSRGRWDVTTHQTAWHYGPSDQFVAYDVLQIDGFHISDGPTWLAEMRDLCEHHIS